MTVAMQSLGVAQDSEGGGGEEAGAPLAPTELSFLTVKTNEGRSLFLPRKEECTFMREKSAYRCLTPSSLLLLCFHGDSLHFSAFMEV